MTALAAEMDQHRCCMRASDRIGFEKLKYINLHLLAVANRNGFANRPATNRVGSLITMMWTCVCEFLKGDEAVVDDDETEERSILNL